MSGAVVNHESVSTTEHVMDVPTFSLSEGHALLNLSDHDLWLRYLVIGGTSSQDEMRRCIDTDACGDREHNVIAQAMNEHFLDQGGDHPVGYRNLPDPPDDRAL